MFLEGDALVTNEDRITNAGLAVALAQDRRDMVDLETTRLALADCAAQFLEGGQKI